MEYVIIDGVNPEISYKLGSLIDPGEAISIINEGFKKNRFKFWLKEKGTLKEANNGKAEKSFPVIIKGKGVKRIAEIGS